MLRRPVETAKAYCRLAAASPSVADMVAVREDGKARSRASNSRSSALRLVGKLLHDQTPRSRQPSNGRVLSATAASSPIAGVVMAGRRLFGCPWITEQMTVHARKRRLGGKESESSAIAHDEANGIRMDFDDVCVRHVIPLVSRRRRSDGLMNSRVRLDQRAPTHAGHR